MQSAASLGWGMSTYCFLWEWDRSSNGKGHDLKVKGTCPQKIGNVSSEGRDISSNGRGHVLKGMGTSLKEKMTCTQRARANIRNASSPSSVSSAEKKCILLSL